MSKSQVAAYVQPQDGEIAQREPPASAEGVLGWARANLFGNITDTIITLVLAVLILWSAWASFSSMVLRANTAGVTQGEGTLARSIVELQDNLDQAEQISGSVERQAEALVSEIERDLQDLARRISVIDLTALETETRLGFTKRILPFAIADRFTIAQSKVPLSRLVELQILQRQLTDPRVVDMPDLSALSLTEAERDTIRLSSAPWFRGSIAQKDLFQSTEAAAARIINANETTDEGKLFRDLSVVRAELDDLLGSLSIEGQSIDAASILEGPSRPARQFNSLVDRVVGTPMTTIPESRLQKIRKDSLAPDQISSLRTDIATAQVEAEQPGLTGPRRTAAIDAAEVALTDPILFLNREMPGGFTDPLPRHLRTVLDEIDFWSVAALLAEPQTYLSAGSTLADTIPQEGFTADLKAPLVIEALAQPDAPQGQYADLVRDLTDAYADQNLPGMRDALEGLAPLTQWAASNSGSNWAVLRNTDTGTDNNWNRMLIGTYTENKIWHLFDPDAEGWQLSDKVWRIWVTLIGFVIAVLPLVAPPFRNRAFYAFSALYPLFLLFMLSGLAIRFYGFNGAEEGAGLFTQLYSEQGRVIQAFVMLLLVILAWFVRTRTPIGKTAGPALLVGQVLAIGYFVIMIWGTIINPEASRNTLLVKERFVGLLHADHPLGEEVGPTSIEAEIAAVTDAATQPGLSAEEAQALRVQAQQLRTPLNAAISAQRAFNNAVEAGEGTFFILPHVKSGTWGGLLVTMVLGVIGMAASLPIGIVLAFGRQSTLPIVRWFSTGLIEITRGVPLIALLLIVVFVLPKLLPAGVEYPKMGLVLLAICLFGGVYQAEVIRGGLQALPKGQYEAAQAMGLTFWQESRLITLPQALKAVIPAIVNTFIGLFKDTTLVIVVGIFDLLTVVEFQITAENAWNNTKPEALLVVSLIFFVLMFSLSRYSIWLEKRLATDHR